MAKSDILARLQIDPGQRTVGQLLQDREAAAHEISHLRCEIDRLRTSQLSNRPQKDLVSVIEQSGKLMRIADVCELLGISRSTIYKRVSDGTFPRPIQVGPRAVRWHVDDIVAWRDELHYQND